MDEPREGMTSIVPTLSHWLWTHGIEDTLIILNDDDISRVASPPVVRPGLLVRMARGHLHLHIRRHLFYVAAHV